MTPTTETMIGHISILLAVIASWFTTKRQIKRIVIEFRNGKDKDNGLHE